MDNDIHGRREEKNLGLAAATITTQAEHIRDLEASLALERELSHRRHRRCNRLKREKGELARELARQVESRDSDRSLVDQALDARDSARTALAAREREVEALRSAAREALACAKHVNRRLCDDAETMLRTALTALKKASGREPDGKESSNGVQGDRSVPQEGGGGRADLHAPSEGQAGAADGAGLGRDAGGVHTARGGDAGAPGQGAGGAEVRGRDGALAGDARMQDPGLTDPAPVPPGYIDLGKCISHPYHDAGSCPHGASRDVCVLPIPEAPAVVTSAAGTTSGTERPAAPGALASPSSPPPVTHTQAREAYGNRDAPTLARYIDEQEARDRPAPSPEQAWEEYRKKVCWCHSIAADDREAGHICGICGHDAVQVAFLAGFAARPQAAPVHCPGCAMWVGGGATCPGVAPGGAR